ncbi:MAG: nucleoside triphosphate pyrophosphohydrolase [Deltaproteobacteria bacterium]|nr:nucleoside triphosphate pyrophosphohydrolase [Deltaproteobacteria bacterium]
MNNNQLIRAITALVDLVSRLRGPGGCPWDAKQTDTSLKTYLLEEAYEVLEAIEHEGPEEVCQELGDLLFQIVFLAQMAEERGEYDLVEVMERITQKMINRHPHVFGNIAVSGPEDVSENWHKIKMTEKGRLNSKGSLLQSVPESLPALLRAHRLNERASRMGLKISESKGEEAPLEDTFYLLQEAVKKGDRDGMNDLIGEILFGLADLARVHGLNSEHILREKNNRFAADFKDAK